MNASHWPMFGFGCLAFLLICTVLAVAVWLVFRSGEKGTTKLGAPAGCLVGCSLVLVALLCALGVALVFTLHTGQELVRHGPFRRFEFELEPPRAAGQPAPDLPDPHDAQPAPRRATLRIELKSGQGGAELSEHVSGWLRENVRGEIGVSIVSRETADGPRTELIFTLDVEEHELERLRRDLREVLPTLRLPRRVEAELKD